MLSAKEEQNIHSSLLHALYPPPDKPMAIITRSFDSLRSFVGSFTWGPFVNLSRSTILGLLTRIDVGQFVVTDTDGTMTICGNPGVKDGSPRTELKVLREAFWVRVLLFADMVGKLTSAAGAPGSVRRWDGNQ